MAGIWYDFIDGEEFWSDQAGEWLDGRYTMPSSSSEFRGRCPAGQMYNDMLPVTHPSGRRFAGEIDYD